MDTARTLTENLAALLRREHDALADFLVALADFDRRGCWRALGHTSLFWFLHRELGLSKGAAFYRKTAAELVQRFPEVIDPLRDGRLCLTSIAALAKVITLENRHEVLPRFFHRSKSEALEVVAELKPVETPPRREVVTAVRLSSPANVSTNASAPASVAPSPEVARTAELALTPGGFPENLLDANSTRAVAQAPTSRDERIDRDVRIEPLTADLRRLHLTVSRRLLEKLDAARDALSHAMPDASTDQILDAALDLLLEKAARRKGIVAKPQKNPRPSKHDGHVPAHVKRAVHERDGGKCQWCLPDGQICGSTRHLQFDHVVPRALGGKSTVDNVRLLCRSHNLEAARRVFGDEVMGRYAAPGRRRSEVAPERRSVQREREKP